MVRFRRRAGKVVQDYPKEFGVPEGDEHGEPEHEQEPEEEEEDE